MPNIFRTPKILSEGPLSPKYWMVIHPRDGKSKQWTLEKKEVDASYEYFKNHGDLDDCIYMQRPVLDALGIIFNRVSEPRLTAFFTQAPEEGQTRQSMPPTTLTAGNDQMAVDLSGFKILEGMSQDSKPVQRTRDKRWVL